MMNEININHCNLFLILFLKDHTFTLVFGIYSPFFARSDFFCLGLWAGASAETNEESFEINKKFIAQYHFEKE